MGLWLWKTLMFVRLRCWRSSCCLICGFLRSVLCFDYLCPFSCACIVCPSSIYSFWLLLWYLRVFHRRKNVFVCLQTNLELYNIREPGKVGYLFVVRNLISHDEWVYSFIAVYMEKLLSGNIKYIMNNGLCFNMLWGSLWKRGTRANIRCNSCGVFQVFFTIHVYEKKV